MSFEKQMASLRAIAEDAENRVSRRQEELTQAAAILAATVGPLATAHRLAELAQEFYELAKDREGNPAK